MSTIAAVLIGICLVALTCYLARRKHRNVWLWGIAAVCGLILTLIVLAFFGDLEKMDPDKALKSRKRERIACGILIALGILRALHQARLL